MLRLGTIGFGGPVALVGSMYRDLVQQRRGIPEGDYKEGLALAQLMPGLTTGDLPRLRARPDRRRDAGRNRLRVTAAAIGAITGAVIVLGQRSITDVVTAVLAVGTADLLWKYKKLPEPILVLLAAVAGLILHPLMTK